MGNDDRWLLPQGIEEILPPQTHRLERLRRELLDLYDGWGYELVVPPVIEFLESLRVGTGSDLDLQTFKLTDQLSGRLMGVRADMTPQVARIDARRSRPGQPARFCYMGLVLHTRGDGFGGSRSPLQIGVELYGHAGYESDLEVLTLLLETLRVAGVADVHLDLGHVAVFRSLVRQAGLDAEREKVLFEVLQRKALPELRALLDGYGLAMPVREVLLALVELNGGEEVLGEAQRRLAWGGDEVQGALETLHQLAAAIQHRLPPLPVSFDLAELRGYHYHTGVVFAAYVPGVGQAVAKGGRYDDIGRVFGNPRPATGFSADLKTLLALSNREAPRPAAVYAPQADDPALEALVSELRGRGQRVIRALPGLDPGPRALGCDRLLALDDGEWVIVPVAD
ncbi:MAG: ATP phosphoribosyltransferase regulatory subunit [Pseudomonadota bacterium]|nr:ATP phosphoribosyltransferase regulatory subunit [Pseudomonadota bacterium]